MCWKIMFMPHWPFPCYIWLVMLIDEVLKRPPFPKPCFVLLYLTFFLVIEIGLVNFPIEKSIIAIQFLATLWLWWFIRSNKVHWQCTIAAAIFRLLCDEITLALLYKWAILVWVPSPVNFSSHWFVFCLVNRVWPGEASGAIISTLLH